MKIKNILLSLCLLSPAVYADLNASEEASVKKLVAAFKSQDQKTISSLVVYPLEREQPLTAIKTPQEFMSRFDQVFDQSLSNEIATSKLTDWDAVGSRGIMFKGGDLWLSDSGKIIAVNYENEKEKRLRAEVLKQEKSALHKSLSQFDEQMLKLKTAQYQIRVDQVGETFRYASWSKNAKVGSRPDLVLYNGTVTYEGSANNHVYRFKNGKYTYEVWRNYVGYSRAPASLMVYKNNSLILEQDADFND